MAEAYLSCPVLGEHDPFFHRTTAQLLRQAARGFRFLVPPRHTESLLRAFPRALSSNTAGRPAREMGGVPLKRRQGGFGGPPCRMLGAFRAILRAARGRDRDAGGCGLAGLVGGVVEGDRGCCGERAGEGVGHRRAALAARNRGAPGRGLVAALRGQNRKTRGTRSARVEGRSVSCAAPRARGQSLC